MTLKNKQLIIFIKTPLPGQCKTRLIPFLSAEQACEFYKTLVSICFENLSSLQNIDICIYTYPNTNDPFVMALAKSYSSSLYKQQGENLGERMFHAIQTSLQSYKQCVLIGTDCPDIDKHYIQQAFLSLERHDMVFGPAEDGGYVLIGATKINASLFDGINWSTNKVLQQSLENCERQKINSQLLHTLRDIDTPQDYKHYYSQTKKQSRNHNG